MSNFPLEKYRFYQNGNKIIAVSTYAGRTVRGCAVCHPDDNFDIEVGKRLAAARCNEKIANKRLNRASGKCFDAARELEKAKQHLADMQEYYNDAFIAYNTAAQEHDKIIAELVKNKNF